MSVVDFAVWFYTQYTTLSWILLVGAIFAGVTLTDPATWKEIHIAREMRDLRKALNDGMDHLRYGYKFRRDHERPEMIVVYDPQQRRQVYTEFAVAEVFSETYDRRKRAKKL